MYEGLRNEWAGQPLVRKNMLIDGKWVPASDQATLSCLDPYSEQEWAEVPVATVSDVDQAVLAARRAFDSGIWSNAPPAARFAALRRLGQLIEDNVEALALAQVRENGKLMTEMVPSTRAVASDSHFFGALGEMTHGYTVEPSIPNFTAYTRREPIGVVAAITPWNNPLVLLGWKLFPALAAGNTIVIKPSEVTPVSTLMLGELIEKAGIPAGVVNIVTGAGATGQALVQHPDVDKIAFTGSTQTGVAIAKIAAERQARVSLELGGKSPNIIFNDANLSSAINGVIGGIFAAAGQACNAGSRVLVQRGVYAEFLERLSQRANAFRMGDPLAADTEIGPLSSRAQMAKVTSYFDIARGENLNLAAGGVRLDRQGLFVSPTVYADPPKASRLVREEIFGPVAMVMPFDDEEEAVALANDTIFGLASGVWTQNLSLAHRMIKKIRAGTVWVNTYRMGGHVIPFGGFKASGVGREMGLHALDQYTESKSVWINTDAQS